MILIEYIIYKVTNKINNKVYIGQTTESLKNRWNRHCGYQLNDGTYFHKAIKKYGQENFTIEIVDKANNQQELDKLEFKYILQYKDNSYNTKFDIGKCGGNTLSNNPNIDKIKEKLSKSKKYDKNPHSKKVKMIDIETGLTHIYNSFKECQDKNNIPRHDIISKRCRGINKKPYLNKYMFVYVV